MTNRRVTTRIIDFTDVKGPPAKPKPIREKLSLEERARRQREFLAKVHAPGREADERRKRRVQYEEDVASGKRRPFYRKRKLTADRTMWWLDDKE